MKPQTVEVEVTTVKSPAQVIEVEVKPSTRGRISAAVMQEIVKSVRPSTKKRTKRTA